MKRITRVEQEDLEEFVMSFPFGKDIANSTFLVTGATGLIGSTFVRCLLSLNSVYEYNIGLVLLVRDGTKAKALFPYEEVSILVQDLTEPFNLTIPRHIDYIIHCASSTSSKFYIEHPVELIKTAVNSTQCLLDYAKENSTKGMVYLSSCEVYGITSGDELIDETYSGYIDTLKVRSGYPLAKRLVECLCHSYAQEYGVNVTIARLTQIFGAGVSMEDNRVFAQFAKAVMNGNDIILHTNGASSKSYCYTIDAVNALFYLLFKGQKGEAYNVANERSYISIRGLAEYLISNFSPNSHVIIQHRDDMGYAPDTYLNMSTEKLQQMGWEPRYELRDMFDRLISYYKEIAEPPR